MKPARARRKPRRDADALAREVDRRLARSRKAAPSRWNADPEDVQRSVARLFLTLIDFVRQLLERQVLRRMDAGTLTPDEIESLGLALMRLEATVVELAARFGLSPEDLDLELGPLGHLT